MSLLYGMFLHMVEIFQAKLAQYNTTRSLACWMLITIEAVAWQQLTKNNLCLCSCLHPIIILVSACLNSSERADCVMLRSSLSISNEQTATGGKIENMSIIKFTNSILASDGVERQQDLFVDVSTGRIINAGQVPEGAQVQTVDLGGRILSPGFIDVQLNGCCGINFSESHGDSEDSTKKVHEALVGLIQTGVTSFLPTLTTAKKEAFQQVGLRLFLSTPSNLLFALNNSPYCPTYTYHPKP